MKKTNYVAPQATLIQLHVENIMTVSFGGGSSEEEKSGDGSDAGAKGASFWED